MHRFFAPFILVWASVLLAPLASAFAATIIDTTPGNLPISSFGESGSVSIIGQTVTVPAVDQVLTDFTFYVDDSLAPFAPGFVKFNAYVYAWDNVNNLVTGPALFTSAPMSTSNNGGLNGYEPLTANTGNLSLSPGGTYVLLFSALSQFDGIIDGSAWRWRSGDPYNGGIAIFYANAINGAGDKPVGLDMEFKATFVSETVPEPSSLALAALGVLGSLLGWRRRKQR